MQNSNGLFSNYQVFDYNLTTEGLTISYTKGEKEMHLPLTPEQTCEAFKKIGLIEHFDMHNGAPVIVWQDVETCADYYGELYRRPAMAWMYFDNDFVKEMKLHDLYNGITMTHIVELHESRKAMDSLFDFIHAIGGTITIGK